MQETQVQSMGQEDPLEKETATHFNILAWRLPWPEEPGGLQFMGSQRVGHNGSDLTHMHIPLLQMRLRQTEVNSLVQGHKTMIDGVGDE